MLFLQGSGGEVGWVIRVGLGRGECRGGRCCVGRGEGRLPEVKMWFETLDFHSATNVMEEQIEEN